MTVQKRSSKTRGTMERIPPGMPRLRTSVVGLAPNKRGYWAKESQFLELFQGGYELVRNTRDDNGHFQGITVGHDGRHNTDLGSLVSRSSGSNGERVYLLQIDKDVYAENQAIKQAHVDEIERAIIERPAVDSRGRPLEFPIGSTPVIQHGRGRVPLSNDSDDDLI